MLKSLSPQKTLCDLTGFDRFVFRNERQVPVSFNCLASSTLNCEKPSNFYGGWKCIVFLFGSFPCSFTSSLQALFDIARLSCPHLPAFLSPLHHVDPPAYSCLDSKFLAHMTLWRVRDDTGSEAWLSRRELCDLARFEFLICWELNKNVKFSSNVLVVRQICANWTREGRISEKDEDNVSWLSCLIIQHSFFCSNECDLHGVSGILYRSCFEPVEVGWHSQFPSILSLSWATCILHASRVCDCLHLDVLKLCMWMQIFKACTYAGIPSFKQWCMCLHISRTERACAFFGFYRGMSVYLHSLACI